MISDNCKIPIILANMMLIYILASFYYLCKTKYIGTPFNDTLSPIQRLIKAKSAQIRGRIFKEGVILAIIIIVVIRPFKKCQ